MIKIVYLLRARADIDPAEFHRYWLEEHGPKMRNIADKVNAVRYVQSHTLATPLNRVLIESRGMSPAYEGITEVWFDSFEAMEMGLGSPDGVAGLQMLHDDERTFVDVARSTMFVTEEHEIFDFTGRSSTTTG